MPHYKSENEAQALAERDSQELTDEELDCVAGGLGVVWTFQFGLGHTIYEARLHASTDEGIGGSVRGVASK